MIAVAASGARGLSRQLLSRAGLDHCGALLGDHDRRRVGAKPGGRSDPAAARPQGAARRIAEVDRQGVVAEPATAPEALGPFLFRANAGSPRRSTQGQQIVIAFAAGVFLLNDRLLCACGLLSGVAWS